MLWLAAGVLAVVSVLWYVGIGQILAAQWTRRGTSTDGGPAPTPVLVMAGPPAP